MKTINTILFLLFSTVSIAQQNSNALYTGRKNSSGENSNSQKISSPKNINQSYIQKDKQTITIFEKLILTNIVPIGEEIKSKYDNKDWRLITWHEPISKTYKFSVEKLDALGYEYIEINVDDGRHKSYAFRNCKNGIIFQVTEWYAEHLVSLSMQWYSPEVRRAIGYLRFCDLK